MKKSVIVGLAIMALAFAGGVKKAEAANAAPAQQQQQPPVAGVIPIGITVDEITVVANGWSVKKQILGQDVFNEKGEKIGKVEDLIVAPDKAVSYGIVSAGDYLGMDKNVAIPASQLKLMNGKLTLPGATKDSLKAMPPFEYAKP
jgi:sporulation protein YlmC with PRC-barrel domain